MECSNRAENCRACLVKAEESQKIFIFTSVKLPDIFRETTSLDIHENDGLPKVLCSICYDRLLEAYSFRKMCSASALRFEILSMDVPEENTSSENLNDESVGTSSLMDIKSESDSDTSNCSTDRDASFDDISDSVSVDETVPELFKKDFDADASLVSGKTQKPKRNTNESPNYLKRKESIHPEEPSGKKRKSVERLCDCACDICDSSFHLEDEHDTESQITFQKSQCEYFYDPQLGPLKMKKFYDSENSTLPKNTIWMCESCDMEFKTVSALRNHCLGNGPSTNYGNIGFPLPRGGCSLRRFIEPEGASMSHFCAICREEKATDEELTVHMKTHLN